MNVSAQCEVVNTRLRVVGFLSRGQNVFLKMPIGMKKGYVLWKIYDVGLRLRQFFVYEYMKLAYYRVEFLSNNENRFSNCIFNVAILGDSYNKKDGQH